MSKNHIDKSLAIATFGDNTDPGNKSVDPIITENYAMFNANSKLETPLWNTEVLSNNISDINTKRLEVVSQVVLVISHSFLRKLKYALSAEQQ